VPRLTPYVGGVRMDEYGEFITTTTDRQYGDGVHTVTDDEPELPG
jgi:hypothetical protein